MKIFTIGFTKKRAQEFFESLRDAGAKRVVDVRLNNVSQLAGFAKRHDLAYFLREICDVDYVHVPSLAPTKEILDAYRKQRGTWEQYEERFMALMARRRIEDALDPALLDGACLLCSEHRPHHCHRRLVAEYLRERWGGIEIEHLVTGGRSPSSTRSPTATDTEPLIPKDAEQKTEPVRTIHHTESGHSVDRAQLLRSERVRKIISEVADKLKVPRTVESRGTTSKSTS